MAWDSSYTAQLNNGFQGVAMNNMAYAQQIGMGGLSGIPGVASGQMMGGVMNRMQGIGAPLLSAGLGLAGLDPMSLGLKAAGAAWGAGGGVMGAGLAGMGVAGGVAGAGMVGAWAGNQMFEGAQHQQQLNTALRGSFNFRNPLTGSQGFAGGQMAQIGGMMRHMTHDAGPGGESVGMGELTSLASNMGRMGMGSQVRDVQEFGRKFRDMVQTLKTVATEMGTSLQEAQQFVSSMRGSGIFRTADQLKYTGQAKGMAFAGGLALSEVTAMGNIGAQISRSVGGLGRQGAYGGMKTIGQIGAAQQMGILSEEDIYNATGQTGAEGRQALAASSMQQSARFLSGGKGRRMLASLAGEDGSLNEGAVQQLLSGGMSTGETMKNAGQNLSKIGRANFLRNEGRLKGAAMERLGGFLPALQLREWMQNRGMDVNEMDDRSMLFAQRQLGMGRDEMDIAVRMAQKLPEISKQMRQSGQDQKYMDDLGQQRRGQGVEGIKNRFNQAREKVQGTLQKVGQDFFNEGSEMIESFMNKLAGNYEVRFSKDAEAAYRGASLGSGAARSQLDLYTKGPKLSKLGTSGSVGGASSRFFEGSMSTDVFSPEYLMKGQSSAGKMMDAGYNVFGARGKGDAALRDRMEEIGSIARAANEAPAGSYIALGTANAKWLQDAYSSGSIAGGGEARMKSFGAAVEKHGTAEMKKAWEKADPAERARMMVGAREGTFKGSAKDEAALFQLPKIPSLYDTGASAADREKAIMESLGIDRNTKPKGGSGNKTVDSVLEFLQGEDIGHFVSSKEDMAGRRAEAAFLDSDAATRAFGGLRSSDSKTKQAMQKEVASTMTKLREKGTKISTDEQGQLDALNRLKAVSDYEDALRDGKGSVSAEALERISKQSGLTPEEIKKSYQTVGASEQSKASARASELYNRIGTEARGERDRLQTAGVATFSGGTIHINKDYAKALGGDKKGAMNDFLMSSMRSVEAKSRMVGVTDPEELDRLRTIAMAEETHANESLQGMSVAEKRKAAKAAGEQGDFGTSATLQESASRQDRFGKAVSRKGVGGAAADALGINLSKDEQASLKKFAGDPDKTARFLAHKMGEGVERDPAAVEDIKRAVSEGKRGGKGVAVGADILSGLGGLESVKKAREEKEQKKNEMQADPGSKLVEAAIKASTAAITSAIGNIKVGGDTEGGDSGKDHPKVPTR